MRLIGWRRVQRSGVYGFAAVELVPVGLRIFEIALLVGSDGPRIALPMRLQFDGDGRQRRDLEGRVYYERILACAGRTFLISIRGEGCSNRATACGIVVVVGAARLLAFRMDELLISGTDGLHVA